jgi:hypothetical protein
MLGDTVRRFAVIQGLALALAGCAGLLGLDDIGSAPGAGDGGATSSSGSAPAGGGTTASGGMGGSSGTGGAAGGAAPQLPTLAWGVVGGDAVEQRAHGVGIDSFGRVVLGGHFEGTLTLGGTSVTDYNTEQNDPPERLDVFVASFDELGALQELQRLGRYGDQEGYGLAIDPSNNVIVGGRYRSVIRDPASSAEIDAGGQHDAYFVKLNDGLAWVGGIGVQDPGDPDNGSATHDQQYAWAVATASDGKIAMVGSFQGRLLFGADELDSTSTDMFAAVFTSDRTRIWSEDVGGSNNQQFRAAAFDSTGALYAGGWADGSVNIGAGGSITLIKFDTTGLELWGKRWGDGNDEDILGVAVDANDNVVVVGHFDNAFAFEDAVTLQSSAGRDIFVVKLAADGTRLWARRLGGPGDQRATAVAVDPAGQIFIAGAMGGSMDFAGQALSASNDDALLLQLDPDGNEVWGTLLGEAGDQQATAVAANDSTIALAGDLLGGSITLDSTTHDAADPSGLTGDVFLAVFERP